MKIGKIIAGFIAWCICLGNNFVPYNYGTNSLTSMQTSAANITELTDTLKEGSSVQYTYNLPVASVSSSNSSVAQGIIGDDNHIVTIKGMKAGKADITILGGSGNGHLVHVTVAQKELGGSERFTLDSLNMQKDDVLNLHIQGDPGDTLQVYF